MTTISPVHPGEALIEEFLEPLGVTQHRLAVAIGVPPRRINEIVHGTRRITADTALRLSRYFGTSDLFWLNLQTRYELEMEKTASAKPSKRSDLYRAPDSAQGGLGASRPGGGWRVQSVVATPLLM